MTNNPIDISSSSVLIVLSRKRMRTSYRDNEVEKQIQYQYDDESLTAFAHIFQNKINPGNAVRELLREHDAVYRLNKAHTGESYMRGARVLASTQSFIHLERLNKAINAVQAKVPGLVTDWDNLVARDMQLRGARAKLSDYPAAKDVPQLFSFDLKIMPMPSTRALPFNLSPEMTQLLQESVTRTLEETEERLRADLLQRMLKPIQHAVERLQVPVGAKGQRFHADSMVSNLRDAVEQAKSLNIGNDADVAALVTQLETVLAQHMNPDMLKHTQIGRDNAKSELDAILAKMGV